jgi:SAM-dependent methyltransferase
MVKRTISDAYFQQALRARALADEEFDCLFPPELQLVSRRFWTPLPVAWRAAEVLRSLGAKRVLDVGCGPGKFCIVAGALAPGIKFVGVEHRSRFVATAREVAARLGVSNAEFAVGDATMAALDAFDAFYLFNPFAENTFEEGNCLDRDVDLSFNRYASDLRRMRVALSRARIGTVVVTYHGFGARPPRGYEQLRADPIGSSSLCVWQKRQDDLQAALRPVDARSDRASQARARRGTTRGRSW